MTVTPPLSLIPFIMGFNHLILILVSDKLRGGGSGVGGLIGQYPNSKLPWIRQLSYPAGCWLKGYHSSYLVRNL